jgi:hypothetical protein
MSEGCCQCGGPTEKRSRDLDTDQLYELQQQLSLIVGQVK